eukprot:TRINITY_DN15730_c0_g3_i1.p1 TRINITY_DN15730_c0_g3~~TRINITY_DN15730_c0_g3_i1.p1  ORF type:complete len:349 (+),score=56.85 TRINITY_DN15730_c0_g3_i1:75-1121(+)
MSRALTVYSRRREVDAPADKQLERIMSTTGCSEPVARNLLKYGKLGIGPLSSAPTHFPDGSRPPGFCQGGGREDDERRAVAAREEKKRKLQQAEARLRELQEKQEREDEEIRRKEDHTNARKNVGLARLGPVLAREEKVDPLQKVAVSRPSSENEDDEEHVEQGATFCSSRCSEVAAMGNTLKRSLVDDSSRRQGKKKKKRRKRDDTSDASSARSADETRPRASSKAAGAASTVSSAGTATGREMRRSRVESSESPARGESGRVGGASSSHGCVSTSSGSLMTEAQVLAMMGKASKDKKSHRGSMRAKSRIQKEMEEWEKSKKDNPDYFKPPKFALCYSGETRKARGY